MPPPNCALQFDPNSVFWAMQNLPVSEATKSFLISGAPGSGKTIAIQLFLQSIAPRFRKSQASPEQLIIFDAKGDILPLLAGMGLRPEDENFHIFNPLDTRSSVWDLDSSFETPAMARALAKLLVPPDYKSNAPYFTEAAGELVYAVILALNATKKRKNRKWNFRDLLCALESPEHIRAVVNQHKFSKRRVATYLNDDKHYLAVISSIATKVGKFDQVASLWMANATGKSFSVTEFLNRPGVLVLGNDPVMNETVWPINAILLKAITNEILRRENTNGPRHWFVLDEFRAMENVDCIQNLLNRGRSKGVCGVLGIQTLDGIMGVYGANAANDLLGMCAYKTFLRSGSNLSAEWAESYFGKVRQMEGSFGTSVSEGKRTNSTTHKVEDRSLFLASTFLDLPFPRAGGTYEAICDVPWFRSTLITNRACDEVFSWCKHPDPAVPAFDPVLDPDAQALKPWNPQEASVFGVEPASEDAGTETKKGKSCKSCKSSAKNPPTRAGKPSPSLEDLP